MSVSPGHLPLIRLLLVLLTTCGHPALARREEYDSTSVVVTSTRTVFITVYPSAARGNGPAPSIPTAASSSVEMESSNSSSLQSAVLNSTNFYRTQHQVEPVKWNDTLADFAEDYAKGCIWKHSVSLLRPTHLQLANIANIGPGRPLRRKPRGRLRQRHPRHRRLGQRTGQIQVPQTEILGGRRSLHAIGLE